MRNLNSIIVFILIITGFFSILNASVTEKDSLVLVAIYDSTDGANWSRAWDLNTPANTWFGITAENNRVTKINLTGSITGTLPPQITDLDSLYYLRFYYTNLSGELPADIGNLSKLETLDFSNNDLGGIIPASLYDLSHLKDLQLRMNNISGELTSDINKLTNLEKINISNNDLSGGIPDEIGSLSQLNHLDLSRNAFDGEIPLELGDLSNLKYINLYWNDLAGSIPAEIGNLDSLENLRLSNNDLNGEIPTTIGNLKKLMYLSLDQNDLTGSIPSEITNCSNLISIRVGYNELSDLPDLSGLKNLSDIWITNNNFSGPFPDFFYSMPQITGLNISFNNFEGELKPEISNWQNMRHFYFANNNLSGTIPKEVGKLKTVTFLELYSNNFTGAIPPEIGEMESLMYLRLHNNQLTEDIPEEIGSASNLRQINFNNNQLEGAVPENFTYLENLTQLSVKENNLTFFPAFDNHSALNRVDIQYNNFTFEDIEPLAGMNINNFFFSPQNSAFSEKDLFTPLNSSVTINMKIGGSANHYKWFKDDVEIVSDAPTGLFNIASMQAEDEGYYHCEVTNDSVPELTIYTSKIHLQVGESNIDSLALVDIYNATGGDQWTDNTNWLSENPISTWFGVTAQSTLSALNLSENNLVGEIPAVICNFSGMESLNLSKNNLSGKIPTEMGRLNGVAVINLADNNFSGRIPEDILLMDGLRDLYLSNNAFSDLPDFSELPLTTLSVGGNQLTFKDIETNLPTSAEFSYSPQDSIGTTQYDTIEVSETFTIMVFVDGSSNNYQWYKDELMIEGATDSVLVVENVTLSDSGSYTCEITSDIVTELTIYSRPFQISVPEIVSSISNNDEIPHTFSLEQNYPNPFNPETKIRYALPKASDVKIEVLNVLGQRVAALVNGNQLKGVHIINFHAGHLASGLYFYTFEAAGVNIKRKMVLLK